MTHLLIHFHCLTASSRLVNIASGVELPAAVEASLLGCHEYGKHALVAERFMNNPNNTTNKKFFDPIPKSKVKPFSLAKHKEKNNSCKDKINSEDMYVRLLAINSFKKVPLERVLAFENTPVPLSLFADDGSMLATKKSDFLEKLEALSGSDPCIEKEFRNFDCFFFDAMSVVQILQPQSGRKTTYNMMAASFWQHILSQSEGSRQIHVVFDRYIECSLKSQARIRRGETVSSVGPILIQGNMIVVDWKKVISNTKSKHELTRFFTLFLTENSQDLLDDQSEVYVAGGIGDTALRVTSSCIEYVPQLRSNHEEADSRLMLHIAYAGRQNTQQACVSSPDTDVLVLLVHFFSELNISQIFFKTGRKTTYRNMTRYIPVHSVFNSLSPQQVNILLPVYCLTGCDTCSSFYGVGKKKAFLVMCKSNPEIAGLSKLGTQENLTVEMKTAAHRFVCLLYGQAQCTSLNSLRSLMVLQKKHTRPRKLPPTSDSFRLHLLRCILQLLIWRSSITPLMPKLNPVDFGYIKDPDTGFYTPQLMTQPVAPPELLSDLICKCTDLCSGFCACSNNEQPCTRACSCEGCTFQHQTCENIFTMLAEVETNDDIIDDGCLD